MLNGISRCWVAAGPYVHICRGISNRPMINKPPVAYEDHIQVLIIGYLPVLKSLILIDAVISHITIHYWYLVPTAITITMPIYAVEAPSSAAVMHMFAQTMRDL